MYVDGNIGNYTSRIHQLPGSVAEVDSFITEGNTYLNSITVNLSGKWERELRLKKYQLTNNGLYFSIQQLGSSSSLFNITDINNFDITDINDDPLQGFN